MEDEAKQASSSTQEINQLCARPATVTLPPVHRHMCTQHLEMIRYPGNRGALLIEPRLITLEEAAQRGGGWEEEEGEEMKGNKVSVRLRRHSGEQAQTTRALLYSASTQDKGKRRK